MEASTVLLALTVLCLGAIVPANGQASITNMETCKKLSLPCGREDAGVTQKYCCVELNGRFPIHSCCNPYVNLAIGLSVGGIILVVLIVAIIVTVWWCTRYHNRKMDRLMIAFRRAQLDDEEESNNEPVNPAAPPPYTPVASAENKPEAGLPVYTESDPFARSEGTDRTAESDDPAEEPTQQNTETQFDDVPLLPDDDETAAA